MLDYFVPSTRFQKLTLFTAIVTYVLVVLGGVVRVTGSGLGCLDWPFCTQPLTDDHLKPALEMSHRFVAAFVTVLIVLVAGAAWRGYRQNKWIFRPALVGLGVIFFQIILGAITVLLKNHPLTVIAHFGAALTMLACATFVATGARLPQAGAGNARTPLRKWAWLSVVFIVGLLFFGALVTGTSSALGCLTDWPLCRGELIPNTTELSTYINWFHRFFALLTGLVLAYTTLVAWRSKDRQHAAWIAAALMLSCFVMQAAIGGAMVVSRIHLVWRGFHLAMAAATWTAAIVLLVLAVRSSQAQSADAHPSARASSSRSAGEAPAVSEERPTRKQLIGAYVKLSKPWIIVLLLITTFAAMLIAQKGLPPLPLVFFTLLGGALSAGGASAINSYIDRDIDGFMSRTKNRPVVTQRIAADNALAYGIAAGVAAFVILALAANLLAAVLSLIGLLYYVFVYTGYLKRSTPHNIVIGGVAGAIPPLVGYAAVTGTVDVLALFLFLVIFYWTPPHTWALGLLIRTDYERVNIPMLPVVAGETETRKQILLYTVQMIAVTLLLFAFQLMGWIYFVAAVLLNAMFLARALKLWRLPETDKALAKRLYKFSQSYLALLFLAMVLDKIILP
ncbi:Protoheme IX farnesyltransferase [Thermoflexales bacterium]|nr:Protoheme IX farnesyltransferase [Thermoflexales bacterium]